MRKEISEKELFETIPVPRAVATLAVPTIISQVVTMIYNLADTFFVGQIGNPYMVAAVSLVSPWFNLLTALGNLFGLGGGSLISRMLGRITGTSGMYPLSVCGAAQRQRLYFPSLHFCSAGRSLISWGQSGYIRIRRELSDLGCGAGRSSYYAELISGASPAE